MLKRLLYVVIGIQIALSAFVLVLSQQLHQSALVAYDGVDRHVEQLLLARGTGEVIIDVISTQGFWLILLGGVSLATSLILLAITFIQNRTPE